MTKPEQDKVLTQKEIDNIFGFAEPLKQQSDGIYALINSDANYEKLPMIEALFERMIRAMSHSLRGFTGENVEVSIDSMGAVRFGDYLETIPLPALMGLFIAEQWNTYGLITVSKDLIYGVVDSLLGNRLSKALMMEDRPYTAIESALMERMLSIVLENFESCFAQIAKINFNLERLETNPRFASIESPNNSAILAKMKIEIEQRFGSLEFLIPYSMIEPVRPLLSQVFVNEKKDLIWTHHIQGGIENSHLRVDAELCKIYCEIDKVMKLQIGSVLMFDIRPESSIDVLCGGKIIGNGIVGQHNGYMAIKLDHVNF